MNQLFLFKKKKSALEEDENQHSNFRYLFKYNNSSPQRDFLSMRKLFNIIHYALNYTTFYILSLKSEFLT